MNRWVRRVSGVWVTSFVLAGLTGSLPVHLPFWTVALTGVAGFLFLATASDPR